ncbi:GTP-binding protein [Methanococcoides alaskense]|uniref:G3E family GTPase n=1 Tax=Methanococcoides alaskense TaxID=325778 RepID=A0AA90TWZ6_9EURY|nr:GTP-binding protein [Methanococcoides alaskense]MDA0525470.1 hypothetical protein [Methanococcoides alaskense]MDR6221595.1 G3E family GTPase [Methanococcoides alaskense]
MRTILLCGLQGSGKTTLIGKIGTYLGERNRKLAIIVTGKGNARLDEKSLPFEGISIQELSVDCVPCSLRFAVEKTLKDMADKSIPEFVFIELEGPTFPVQIKESLEHMPFEDLSFLLVYLIDAGTFSSEIEKLPKFIITQIKESEIIGINKIDSTDEDKVFSIRNALESINPGVRIFEFSARDNDEGFRKFVETLAGN